MESVIFNRACWVYKLNGHDITSDLELLLIQSEFSILGSIDHRFSPQGYTKIWLLGESHFAVHTFPEQDAFYIELSSCVEMKATVFWSIFDKWINSGQATYQLLPNRINRGVLK